MDVDNVKLPWEEILESYITHYEQLRPDLDVRTQMAPIISDLNNNRIKSRAIMSSGSVVCYAFYVSPESMSDRYYGMVGFVSPDDYSRERLKNIITWLQLEASRDSKILMFNEIFNGKDYGEDLQNLGMSRIDRVMMLLDGLDTIDTSGRDAGPGVTKENIIIADVPDIVRLHEAAYAGSADQILESTNPVERSKFWVNLFDGRAFGRFLQNASFWITENGVRIGALITTLPDDRPLVADVFVLPERRRCGYARQLMLECISALREGGFNSLVLWVTRGNPAQELYRSLGFVEVPDKVETIFFKRG